MNIATILFETVDAAQKAYNTLQYAIDVNLDCNAISFERSNEELVEWLVSDVYYNAGVYRRINHQQELVLLVDDDLNLLLLLAEYLEYKGLETITAKSGEEGWKRYCTENPGAIVSGIAMETTDAGYSLLQRVRDLDPRQPFIFLSSQLRIPSKRARAIELGADACFMKPFEPEDLFRAIAKIIV